MERKEQIQRIVCACLSDALEEFDAKPDISEETIIYGPESPLDSTAVVSLIVDIEMRLEEEMGFSISLTDESAMSQEKSPFRSVKNMVGYLWTRCQGEEND